MTKFRTIDDSFHQQAGQAIKAASDAGFVYPEYDNAELVAAAAAVALERGAPRLIAQSYDIGADSYLKQGSQAWRKLHPAVARFIETDLNESEKIADRGDGVRMVVADVVQAESARKVVMAAGNKDFEDTLNPEQLELMKMARGSQSFLRDLSNISIGSLDRLSEETASSLEQALNAPIPGKLGQEVSLLSRAVDGIVDREEALDERMRAAEGDYLEFQPISDTYRRQVMEFHAEGTSTGVNAVDSAMSLLKDMDRIPENMNPNDPIMIAQARLLQESMVDVSQAPSDLAAMALSDAAIMNDARRKIDLDPEPFPELGAIGQGKPFPELAAIGQGAYDTIGVLEGSGNYYRRIMLGLDTPAIDKIKLEVAMLENSGIASLDRAHTRANQESIDPALAEDVAKAAGAVMDRHPDDDAYAFVQMGHMLSDFHHGKRDDRSLVQAAEELAQTMDDRSMSGSAEWEALSKSVDKALGRGQGEPFSRAASMQALEAGAVANPVMHEEGPAKISRAQHMAAMNNGMGI